MTNQEIIQEMTRLKQASYGVLGLSPTADINTVNQAYQRLTYEWRPNRFPHDANAFDRFAQLCHAREIILGGDAAFQQRAIQNLMQGKPTSSTSPITPATPVAPDAYNPYSFSQPNQASFFDAPPPYSVTPSAPPFDDEPTCASTYQDAFNAQKQPPEQPAHDPAEETQRLRILLALLQLLFDCLKKGVELYMIAQANTVIIERNHYYQEPHYRRAEPAFECHFGYHASYSY